MRRLRVQPYQANFRFGGIKTSRRLEKGCRAPRQTQILRKSAETCRGTDAVLLVAGQNEKRFLGYVAQVLQDYDQPIQTNPRFALFLNLAIQRKKKLQSSVSVV